MQGPHEKTRPRESFLRRQLGVTRDPEVQELHLPGRGIVDDVLGLQVAVDDAGLVGGAETCGQLARDRRGVGGSERPVAV